MKKLLVLLSFCAITNLYSQSWKSSSGGNAFDGKYKTAYVQGVGSEFPYNKPLLTVNLYNDESLNFYIASAGYFQSESETSVKWIFSNEPNVIYITDDLSISKDNKIIFLNSFKNSITSDYLSRLDFINKLKTASRVDVRISDKYDDNDIVFKLSGSSRAINFVISKKYKNKIEAIKKEIELEYELKRIELEAELEKERLEKEQRELSIKRITTLLSDYSLKNVEIENVIKKIVTYSKRENFKLDSIQSIKIEPTKTLSAHLHLLNLNKDLIYKIDYIDYEAPSYIAKLKGERRNLDSIHISKIIKEYKLSISESNNLLEAILKKSINSYSLLTAFDSLSINLPSKFISTPNIYLIDKDTQSEMSIPYASLLIPEYIKKLTVKRERDIIDRSLFLLSKYELTKEEELKIVNNFKVAEVLKTKAEDIADVIIVLNRKIPGLTKINLLNASGINLYTINIADKAFTKQLKRKISKLKLG